MPRILVCECGECRTCRHRIRQRDRYRQEPGYAEKCRVSVNRYRTENIVLVRERDRVRGFRETDPLKIRARNATRILGKGTHPCECGKKPADAHHEDYTKPLDVIWLCETCHGKQHRIVQD